MTDDEALWKKRFQMFALVRLVGLAIVPARDGGDA